MCYLLLLLLCLLPSHTNTVIDTTGEEEEEEKEVEEAQSPTPLIQSFAAAAAAAVVYYCSLQSLCSEFQCRRSVSALTELSVLPTYIASVAVACSIFHRSSEGRKEYNTHTHTH